MVSFANAPIYLVYNKEFKIPDMKIFIKVLFAFILLQPFYAFSESEGLKILVVGAGISGLGVARDLHDSGYKVTVLEARNKIGGRIDTDRSLGFPIERGANWIHSNEGRYVSI